jgi:uncharacterized protein (DUF1499 family)
VHRLIAWLTVNEVTTESPGLLQPKPPYPEVRPLDLDLSPDEAYDLALATARRMRGWRIVQESPQEGSLNAEAKTPLLRFVDDVRVWIEARSGGGCRVHMRSRSRVGQGDFGANASRIRAFLQLVEKRADSRPHFPPPG